MHDLHHGWVLDDRVDDPVVAAACGVETGELVSEWFADAARVPGERAEDGLNAGYNDLLRKALEIAVCANSDLDLVGPAHVTP